MNYKRKEKFVFIQFQFIADYISESNSNLDLSTERKILSTLSSADDIFPMKPSPEFSKVSQMDIL
jgi:hypothetical protein